MYISLLRLPWQNTTDWWLKEQKFTASRNWRLEVQDQGVGRFNFF